MMAFHWACVTVVVAIRYGLVILHVVKRFIVLAVTFGRRAAHVELARPDGDEFHADGIGGLHGW